ncbi:MAG: hypothetical protein IT270_15380 [Saprospiraceae bacterium]|nr:hypothetical protein [Saprospiraceae bacterium]
MDTSKKNLEDFPTNPKIKLAALWTSVMFCYVYGDFFSLFVPNRIGKMMSNEAMLDTPEKLMAASVLMTVPSIMIAASVFLKPVLNRWLNIVFGILYTAIMLLIAFTSSGSWWTFYIYLALVESLLTAYIVWTALKWPLIANR